MHNFLRSSPHLISSPQVSGGREVAARVAAAAVGLKASGKGLGHGRVSLGKLAAAAVGPSALLALGRRRGRAQPLHHHVGHAPLQVQRGDKGGEEAQQVLPLVEQPRGHLHVKG